MKLERNKFAYRMHKSLILYSCASYLFFVLIGKKNFIKESQCVHKICTKRPNSYKIEGEAETKFKETIKSATQLAVEKPHTLD